MSQVSRYHPLLVALHWILAALMALIALHVAGALYHTLILKDGLPRRMFFGRRVLPTTDSAPALSQPLPGGR